MTDVRAGEPGGRPLSIPMFIGLVVVYLVVVQGVGLLLAPDGADYGELPDSETVRTTIVIPVALSLLLTAAAVSYLRWWRPVMRDDRPTRRWVLIVPVLLLVAILLTVNYGNLADQDIELVLLLALGTLLVGVTEELMFRGIGVVTFRRAGLTEVKVALWSSLVFGAVHATNIFTEGPSAFLQALIVSVTGFFFYLCRRSTGTLVVPMLLHGAYDFSIFSSRSAAAPSWRSGVDPAALQHRAGDHRAGPPPPHRPARPDPLNRPDPTWARSPVGGVVDNRSGQPGRPV